MTRLKVALVHNLPPGGARRVVEEYLRRSTDFVDVFEVDLGRANRWPELPPVASSIGETRRYAVRVTFGIGTLGLLAAAERVRGVYQRMADDIDSAGYDVVFVHHDQFSSAPPLLEMVRTRTVYLCHEPRRQSFEYEAARRSGGFKRTIRAPYDAVVRHRDTTWTRAADHVVTCSVFAAEGIARAYGVDAQVAYLGVDPQVFTPARARPDENFVLCVGAIDRLKGQHFAVEALARIPAARRPILELVFERSDASYLSEVEARAAAGGVEVRLRRSVTDLELAERYASATATLCLSRLEPFGLTAIESISSGTPVVAVREGGFRESVTDGRNGRLVWRSADAIAAGIEDASDIVASGREAIRASILPFWSWERAVPRLREAMRGDGFT